MVTDRFGVLLEELGRLMKIKLTPDQFNACVIRMKDKLELIIRPAPNDEDLFLIVEIAPPGTGSYRVSLLKEALQANAQTECKRGIFCYGAKKDTLVLYRSIPLHDLTGQLLLEMATELCDTVRTWKECITRGEIPQRFAPHQSSNIFGLK